MDIDIPSSVVNTRSSGKDKSFLRNKRNFKSLKENYLYRRIFSGKIAGKYEENANSFYNMLAFDWEDEKLNKHKSNISNIILILVNNMNSTAFWFYVTSNYFPYASNDFLKQNSENILTFIKEVMDKNIYSKRPLQKNSNLSNKSKFLDEISAILENKNDSAEEIDLNNSKDLEKMITILDNKLKIIKSKNENILDSIFQTIQDENFICSFEDEFAYDQNDILIDMNFNNKYIKEFRTYLINKHERDSRSIPFCEDSAEVGLSKQKNKFSIFTREEEINNSNPDDIVCLVCNDGDYEENDLIVYCSECQLTVHQNCYGITVLPEGDWICYPCQVYKEKEMKNNIECALCPVRGGAMKPSYLKKTSNFYNFIIDTRSKSENFKFRNTEMQVDEEFNQKNSETNFLMDVEETKKADAELNTIIVESANKELDSINADHEEMKIDETNANATEIKTDKVEKKRGRKKEKNQNSDASKNQTDSINLKIAHENAWVHLSCAIWIPEVEIVKFDVKDEITSKLSF
jgi:hypothetical protein